MSIPNQPSYLIDTNKVNAQNREGFDNPFRLRRGVTQIDIDCLGENLVKTLYERGKVFIEWLRKEGWELQGELRVIKPQPAMSDLGLLLPGQLQYEFIGVFKYNRPMRIVRTEVDSRIVRQGPDHEISVEEAAKILGIGEPSAKHANS